MQTEFPKLISYEVVARHSLYPLLKAVFVDKKANIIEVTLLSQGPYCFEIVRNGILRESNFYPENTGYTGNLFLMLQHIAKRQSSK